VGDVKQCEEIKKNEAKYKKIKFTEEAQTSLEAVPINIQSTSHVP